MRRRFMVWLYDHVIHRPIPYKYAHTIYYDEWDWTQPPAVEPCFCKIGKDHDA